MAELDEKIVVRSGNAYSEKTKDSLIISEGFISPRSYGAIMDGVTDDRTAFLATLAAAELSGDKILIDRDIFLDVEEIGTKSIFLEDNTWIEGANDASIIVNNLKSNAFVAAISDNITFKNIDIVWDNAYDADFSYSTNSTDNSAKILQLRDYLVANRGMTFSGANPIWRGPISYMYIFLLDAATNVTFDNVEFRAKGETADKFIIGAVKFKEEFAPNQAVSTETEPTVICENITFRNVTMDGVLMGVQGPVDTFISEGMISKRYSDAQNEDGTTVGGVGGWMPPPHLFYLNTDSSTSYTTKNVTILDTYDYGDYVGSVNTRPLTDTQAGYCPSLKLVEDIDNAKVDNYTSLRRDGMFDIGSLTNSSFTKMYSKSDTSIFDSSTQYYPLRFLGIMNNVIFDDITLIDEAVVPTAYPMNAINNEADNITMTNIKLFVKDFDMINAGPFGFSGSNNTIEGKLFIENMTGTFTNRGLIYHNDNSMNTDSNNNYTITVTGFRDISSDFLGLRSRMLFAKPINPNNNYAKVFDTSNNLLIEQNNELVNSTWKRSENVTLGSGTEQALGINIPSGFAVSKVTATVVSALDDGVTTLSLGTVSGVGTNLISNITKSVNAITINSLNETTLGSARTIFIKGDASFNSTGEVKITVELKRWDTN